MFRLDEQTQMVATMDEALNQPDLPPFVASVTTSEAGTTFVVSIRSR